MRAHVGDAITVPGRRVGDAERHGQIVEVRGSDGQPPYVVRWDHDDHDHVLYPSPELVVLHKDR